MADGSGIKGADNLRAVSKALKQAGEQGKGLKRELNKGIRAAAKPVTRDVKAAARRDLPKGGGLNVWMARSSALIRIRPLNNPGVDVYFPKRQDGYIDGVIRHPVFARRERVQGEGSKRKDGTVDVHRNIHGGGKVRWVTQNVNGDWFDGTVERSAPVVRPEIEKAIEAVAQQIVRSVD